jgi:hypothetical protein
MIGQCGRRMKSEISNSPYMIIGDSIDEEPGGKT